MLRSDLTAAFMLLTRLPVGWFIRPGDVPDAARCVWAFPVVGLAVNVIAGLCYGLAHRLGVPPLLAAAWTLAVALMMTGGFHEDGLADTADGFGGGATAAKKLDIMRDSRIGSYGALALLLSGLIRVTAIAAIERPIEVMTAMIVAGIAGRSAMVLLLLLLKPARGDGMGAALGRPRAANAVFVLGIAGVAPFVFLLAGPAVAVVALGAVAALGMARLAGSQIKGFTGDVLGACEVVVECVIFTVIASAARG